jgi:hypothetical protein
MAFSFKQSNKYKIIILLLWGDVDNIIMDDPFSLNTLRSIGTSHMCAILKWSRVPSPLLSPLYY